MEVSRDPHDGTFTFRLSDEDWGSADCRAFLDELKGAVPAHARSYDKVDQAWTVGDAYAAAFEALRARHFGDDAQMEML